MSIEIQILGQPGEDNATLFKIDSGSAIHRLLFDCGEKCLNALSISDIQSIDHLFFSHFHMDHVCGFDTFFRLNYNRPGTPVTIWGPPGTIELIRHRMLGYTWNRHHRQPGEWVVNELTKSSIKSARFYTREAFRKTHRDPAKTYRETILEHIDYSVSAQFLNHGSIPSVGYRVDEAERNNIDPARLDEHDFKPGPWIRVLKESHADDEAITLNEKEYTIADLRKKLMVTNTGESAAYLTDFTTDQKQPDWKKITTWLNSVGTIVCESQYLDADDELARANSHMTAGQVAKMAKSSKAKELIIQHVSRRYDYSEWNSMLSEAKAIFPQTRFPGHWKIS